MKITGGREITGFLVISPDPFRIILEVVHQVHQLLDGVVFPGKAAEIAKEEQCKCI